MKKASSQEIVTTKATLVFTIPHPFSCHLHAINHFCFVWVVFKVDIE
jgi:hypothetical protein